MPEPDFAHVKTGLKVVLWGVVVYLTAVVIVLVFGGHPTIDKSAGIIGSVALFLMAVGQILSHKVPSSMPGSSLVLGAIACTVSAMLISISLFFWDPKAAFGNVLAARGMILLGSLLFMAGDIQFNFFLKYLAQYVRDNQNASRAGALITLKAVTLLMVLVAVILIFSVEGTALLAGVLLFLTLIIWVLIVFQYMALLSGLSYSLAGASRRSFDPEVPEEVESENPFDDFQ